MTPALMEDKVRAAVARLEEFARAISEGLPRRAAEITTLIAAYRQLGAASDNRRLELADAVAAQKHDLHLPLEVDGIKNDGDYGSGEDAHSGFSSYVIIDARGFVILDSLNADWRTVAVQEEWDEDGGHSAWDELARCRTEEIVRRVNAYDAATADLRTLLASHASLEERVKEAKRLAKPFAEAAENLDDTNDFDDDELWEHAAAMGLHVRDLRALAAFVNEKET